MKILITGSTGLLGQALVKRLALSFEVRGLSRLSVPQADVKGHVVCDLTDAQATVRMIEAVNPGLIIHAQALSDVDRCEREPAEAEQQNVRATQHLCEALAMRDHRALLVAVSTDYVFDGSKGRPYDEMDEPRPLSVYGKTKLAAERLVLAYPGGYVVRPSTLMGPGRANFCNEIVLRSSREHPIQAYVDQTTSPTYTADLAEGLDRLAQLLCRQTTTVPRIYHLTNAGSCTRVEFARRVLELLGRPTSLIQPIQMSDHPRPAPRPVCSALVSRHVGSLLGRTLRPWHEALQAYLISQHWIN